jgi:hypothetical protein
VAGDRLGCVRVAAWLRETHPEIGVIVVSQAALALLAEL